MWKTSLLLACHGKAGLFLSAALHVAIGMEMLLFFIFVKKPIKTFIIQQQ